MLYSSRLAAIGLHGWLRLGFAFVVMVLEALARALVFFIPTRLLLYLDNLLLRIFPKRTQRHLIAKPEDVDHHGILDFSTPQLVKHFHYICEEHVVTSSDGFVLSLHRITGKLGDDNLDQKRPPVFLQHGLMQSSEAWVCTEDALAFRLVDQGYDVWLGNTRGNKYSCHHRRLKPTEVAYWDFSLDQMALIDLPAVLTYVLKQTGYDSLSYVAFSQGTALGFACFSLMPDIASKINHFIALSPAAKAKGLKQGMLQTFVHLAPQSIFLAFGTKGLMKSVLFWRASFTRSTYARLIDASCRMLFDWKMGSLGDMRRKKQLYAHLFALTSVKTVVHWFQIVACDRFQAYDENMSFEKEGYRPFVPQIFPIRQIKCPMSVFYGSDDHLTDIPWLLRELPLGSKTYSIDTYEHLDTIWAHDAKEKVFPLVISLLNATNKRRKVAEKSPMI